MSLTKMVFAVINGLRDKVAYPRVPADEDAAREQIQGRLDELRDFMNNFLTVEVDTHIADTVTDADGVHGLKVEEGVWLPTLEGSTTAGSHTYTTRDGAYYKIGKVVVCSGAIKIGTKDAAMAGNVLIGSLPFVAKASTFSAMTISYLSLVDYTTNYNSLNGIISGGTSKITILQSGDNIAATNLPVTAVVNNTEIRFSITYQTA